MRRFGISNDLEWLLAALVVAAGWAITLLVIR